MGQACDEGGSSSQDGDDGSSRSEGSRSDRAVAGGGRAVGGGGGDGNGASGGDSGSSGKDEDEEDEDEEEEEEEDASAGGDGAAPAPPVLALNAASNMGKVVAGGRPALLPEDRDRAPPATAADVAEEKRRVKREREVRAACKAGLWVGWDIAPFGRCAV